MRDGVVATCTVRTTPLSRTVALPFIVSINFLSYTTLFFSRVYSTFNMSTAPFPLRLSAISRHCMATLILSRLITNVGLYTSLRVSPWRGHFYACNEWVSEFNAPPDTIWVISEAELRVVLETLPSSKVMSLDLLRPNSIVSTERKILQTKSTTIWTVTSTCFWHGPIVIVFSTHSYDKTCQR